MKWKQLLSSLVITITFASVGSVTLHNNENVKADAVFTNGLPEELNGTWQSDLIKSRHGYVQNEVIVNEQQREFNPFTKEFNENKQFVKNDNGNGNAENPKSQKIGANKFIIESGKDTIDRNYSIKYIIDFQDKNHFSLWYYRQNKVYYGGNFSRNS